MCININVCVFARTEEKIYSKKQILNINSFLVNLSTSKETAVKVKNLRVDFSHYLTVCARTSHLLELTDLHSMLDSFYSTVSLIQHFLSLFKASKFQNLSILANYLTFSSSNKTPNVRLFSLILLGAFAQRDYNPRYIRYILLPLFKATLLTTLVLLFSLGRWRTTAAIKG